jgi:DNA polymerase-3 subunit delta'
MLHQIMNVPGQQRAKDFLNRLAHSERVPHALLFIGPTGSGNLALALEFARYLQCEHPGDTGPCGQCKACVKTGQMAHPDVHFSYPTIGGGVSTDFIKQWRAAMSENPFLDVNTWLLRIGAENKQGNINKDECNAIIKKLSLKTFEGRYKILVMWLPEYLGKEGNRLLKLIEEPPEGTIFLLAAENAELILPTILSRCQLVRTDKLSDQELVQSLLQMRDMDAARAQSIAFLADGDLHQALQLADNTENDDGRMLLDWLRRCWKGNGIELVQWAEMFAAKGRENQKRFLQYGLYFLREMNLLTATGNTRLRLQAEELQTAQNMAKVLNLYKIEQIARFFNDNYYYIERNANPKILFLDTSIKINQILKK